METVILFDPSIRSLNMGDHIIMNSAEMEIGELLENRYVIHCATHAPVVTFYQSNRKNPRMTVYDNAKYKFVCGSNLLWKNLFIPRPTFNINIFNCMPYEGSILFGVGTNSNTQKINYYTKKLYNKILSKEYIHSVRDDYTLELLKNMGYKAINTGCPTMWKFTEEFCSNIPESKANNVVFTLTDYNQDINADQKMIDTLVANYDKVYFWIQGVFDMEYFSEFKNIQRIEIISPTISEYSKVLQKEDIEYVGTRLHAGMFALQHKKRSIIISVDDRVRSMKKSYNINCLERSNINYLEKMIFNNLSPQIILNTENIRIWKQQFERKIIL